MKHLLKKISSRGGGGSKKPKVTPAVLNPPEIGNFQFGASFSIAENIDLISDGPIEGLVDPEGNKLPRSQISRGVYLDGTAVSVAGKNFDPNSPIGSSFNIQIAEDSFGGRANSAFAGRYTQYSNIDGATMVQQWDANSREDYRTSDGQNYDRMTDPDNGTDGTFYNDGIYIGKGTANRFAGGEKDWGYVQLNSPRQAASKYELGGTIFNDGRRTSFSESTLTLFTAAHVKKAITKDTDRNIDNLEFFFKKRAEEEAARLTHGLPSEGSESKGAMTPLIDLLDELKSLVNIDGTIKNQKYYNLIETTLTNALGDREWEKATVDDVGAGHFLKGNGQIVMYYPPRNLLSASVGQEVANPEDLKFELVGGGSIISLNSADSEIYNLLVPVVDENNQLTGNVIGAYIIHLPYSTGIVIGETNYYGIVMPKPFKQVARTVTHISLIYSFTSNLKYNYSNVLIEQKLGEESQGPLNFFNKI